MRIRHVFLAATVITGVAAQTADVRLVRSLSGPSGKVVGDEFTLDSVRNRFAYPEDRSFVVYFEWEGPPGEHRLTGLWKGPDGRTMSISSDITLRNESPKIAAYWTYEIVSGLPSGVWSLDVRLDGRPAGSHSFELVVPAAPAPKPVEVEPVTKSADPDVIYRTVARTLTWIHRLDASGRRKDTCSGFVFDKGLVATAFQCVDSAAALDVEFASGRVVRSERLAGWDRMGDWALVEADTGPAEPVARGDSGAVGITTQLLVYNAEANQTRTFGRLDMAGRNQYGEFGERLMLSVNVAPGAVGGPLLNSDGAAIGIVGGSIHPGARTGQRDLGISPALFTATQSNNSATPIAAVRAAPAPATLADLASSGVLSAPLAATPNFLYGGTSTVGKLPNEALPTTVSDFSRRDEAIWVYTAWQRKDKTKRGMVGAKIYDAANKLRVDVQAKRVNIPDFTSVRHMFSFPPKTLAAATYRVDVTFDGQVVWRTFFRLSE